MLLLLLVRNVPSVCAVAGVPSVANTQLLLAPLLLFIISFSSFPFCGWCLWSHSWCCWRSAVADVSADDIVIDVAMVSLAFFHFFNRCNE